MEHFARLIDDIEIYRRFCQYHYGSDHESETLKGLRWAAASWHAAGIATHFETGITVENIQNNYI